MFKKCPRSVNNFRTEHLGGYFWDFWSPYVAEASLGRGYNVAEASLGSKWNSPNASKYKCLSECPFRGMLQRRKGTENPKNIPPNVPYENCSHFWDMF